MDLTEQIRRYEPFNRQEEQDQKLILSCLRNMEQVFFRENAVAHMTASAWVLNHRRDQVLLAYHCNLTLDFGHPLSWYVVAIFVFCCGYFSNRIIVSTGISRRKLALWTVAMCVSMAIRVIAQRVFDGTVLYDRVVSIWTNAILDIWIVCFIYHFVSKERMRFDCEIIRQGDRISYAFYLVHAMVLELCFTASLTGALFVAVAFSLSVLAAYFLNFVSGHIIEFGTHKRGIEQLA